MKPTMEESNVISVTIQEKQSVFSESFLSYKTIIDNLKDNQSLLISRIKEGDAESLAQALKGSQITKLDLSNSNLGFNGLKYLTQVLRDTQITSLNLSNSNIMDEGVKNLSECLKDTQITALDLSNNNIMDEGVKYLAECLKDTKITDLYLSKNKIGCDAAQYLNMMLSNTKIVYLYLDIHYTEDHDANKYIYQVLNLDMKNIRITLYNNKIGIEGAQYLNKICQNIEIVELKLDSVYLEADDAQYLAQAFKNTKISEFRMFCNHIMQPNGIRYLVQAFKDSQITLLNMIAEKIGATGAQYLADFLREVKVLYLNLDCNYIRDEGMKYLAPAIENSDIMSINLSYNDIKAEGARYLSEILKNSKVVFISLCHNTIGPEGARYLAEGLPYSQVTSIHLHGNSIEYAGYRYLIDVADITNISWVNLHCNNIEEGLEKGTKLWPYSLQRNNTPIAHKICHAFKELVSLNPMIDEFEFIVPTKNTFPPVDIDQYAFLIRTLKDTQNSKVHIFLMLCTKGHGNYYDYNTMNKINEFIAIMPSKFNAFIDSKLPVLVEKFDSSNYVNLVKEFEDMKLYDIVQNLLLHRVLYYVDENQEILHPYIYKMLDKYSMPLYNEQLEPNKKEEIIAYYQSHQEIDGVQEIIDLLGSENFS